MVNIFKLIFVITSVILCFNNILAQNKNPETIDLDLPSGLLWCTYNLGAESPEDFGDYYLLSSSEDIVSKKFGGGFSIPSKIQFDELIENTIIKWITINGVAGMSFEGSNGNSIFLPAAAQLWYDGWENEWQINNAGSGAYWTSDKSDTDYNWFLEFSKAEDKPFFGDRDINRNKLSIRPVENIKLILNIGAATLMPQNTLQLEAIVNKISSDKELKWTSDNPEVAKVSGEGLVTALKKGVANIYSSYENVSAKSTITVVDEESDINIVKIKYSIVNIYKGEHIQFEAFFPAKDPYNHTFEWETGNPSIATVSSTGLLTGVTEGYTYIRVSSEGQEATATVRVIDRNNNGDDTGIESLEIEKETEYFVYSMDGVLFKKTYNKQDLKTLPKGLYIIINGTKQYKIAI